MQNWERYYNKIETAFGPIYIEKYDLDRHHLTNCDEWRITLLDSNFNYLNYFNLENTSKEDYEDIIKAYTGSSNAEDLVDCNTYGGIEFQGTKKECLKYLIENDELDDDFDIDNNEYINRIGDTYFIIA